MQGGAEVGLRLDEEFLDRAAPRDAVADVDHRIALERPLPLSDC